MDLVQMPLASPPCRSQSFQGDVSGWGRKNDPGFYHKGDSASSDYTLSSGLSPRDDDQQRKEFDLKEAKSVSRGGLLGCRAFANIFQTRI